MPLTIVPDNRLKRSLRDGRRAIGTMVVEIRQTSIVYLLANAGFDFVLIDGEHGPFNLETIADLSRTARLAGVTPIVRVPELSYPAVTQVLDAGAQGIMLPRVAEAAQVREAVAMMKYPPDGRRGSVLARGHTGFLGGPLVDAMRRANEETMLIVQVETREAVSGLDDILAVPGVDAALVGPTDLSIALGVPGLMEAPEMEVAITETITACRRHNVWPGIHTNDTAMTRLWASRGMMMVSNGAEIGYLMQAASAAVQELRSL